jgi:hypothetical protein
MDAPANRLSQPMDEITVVWLQETNKYLQFREPAREVFSMLSSSHSHDDIAAFITGKYGLPQADSAAFVADIARNIDNALHPGEKSSATPEWNYPDHNKVPYRVQHYQAGNRRFVVCYPSAQLFHSVDPFISHLSCNSLHTTDANLTFLQQGGKYGLLYNGDLVFAHGDFMHLLGSFYLHLVSDLSGISPANWMTVCHASAVTNGSVTLLVTGPSGAGKSTLTGLLTAHGLSFVADDFVAIAAENSCAYPFPAALSVKKGAVDVLSPWYHLLKQQEVHTHIRENKEIRFLPMPDDEDFYRRIYPVKQLVFPVYKAGSGFESEKLHVSESLKLYFEQSWVSDIPGNVRHFLQWYSGLQCYRITYSDNGKAIRFIKELLKEENDFR